MSNTILPKRSLKSWSQIKSCVLPKTRIVPPLYFSNWPTCSEKTHGGKNGRYMQSLIYMWDNRGDSPLECKERTWAAWPLSQPVCPVSWSMIPSLLVIEMLMMIERDERYCRYDGKVRQAGKRYCGWQGGHLGNAMCFPGTREWRREICNTRPPCNTAVL